jgi:predicted Fe-Mo cluster-binding NifX family protein
MRLAIPEFNGRVSPVFDFCRRLVVIEVEKDGPLEQYKVDWSFPDACNRADRLEELKIDALLCGGISSELAGDVARKGIRVFPWISGRIQEVLDAFLTNRLPDPRLTMPGCPGRQGARRGPCRGRGARPRWR